MWLELFTSLLFSDLSYRENYSSQISQAAGNGDEIVVTAANVPRCRARLNDPLDAISSAAPISDWYFIVGNQAEGYVYLRSRGKNWSPPFVTPLDRWRRAGNALPSFVFRQPEDGSPMCIGKRQRSPDGAVQLQQKIAATPYNCKTIRLTMFVASKSAEGGIWFHAGAAPVIVPIRGTHGWIPIKIDWGPIAVRSRWLEFGAMLQRGDIWLYRWGLEVVPDEQLTPKTRRDESVCRMDAERYLRQKIDSPGTIAKENEQRSDAH